jgi:hypothetical protein
MLGLDKATSDGPEREISSAPANFLSAFAERALRAFIDSAGEATR